MGAERGKVTVFRPAWRSDMQWTSNERWGGGFRKRARKPLMVGQPRVLGK